MEIVTGIGDFLPDPVGAIMQPIAGIFNTIFGIGEGPTAEEVIREACHGFPFSYSISPLKPILFINTVQPG